MKFIQKMKRSAKKTLISVMSAFTFASVVTVPCVMTSVNAISITDSDVYSAIEGLTGWNPSTENWQSKFGDVGYLSTPLYGTSVGNDVTHVTSDDYSSYSGQTFDCVRLSLSIAGHAMKNAGYTPTNYITAVGYPSENAGLLTGFEESTDASSAQAGDILEYRNSSGANHLAVVLGWQDGVMWTISGSSSGHGPIVRHYSDTAGSGGNSGTFYRVYKFQRTKDITVGVKKSSSLPSCTDGNSLYTFSGMTFDVFSSSDCNENSKLGTLTTDANGNANATYTVSNDVNTVYVKETSANTSVTNYKLTDTSIHTVDVSSGSGTASFTDEPLNDPLMIQLTKVDAEGKTYIPSLENAIFEVKYYSTLDANSSDDVANMTPTKTWYFKTIKLGNSYRADMRNEQCYDHGDSLYRNLNGNVTYLLGSYTVTEYSAPTGYTVEGGYLQTDETVVDASETFFAKIESDSDTPTLKYGNQLTDPDLLKAEMPIRGSYDLQKQDGKVLVDASQTQYNGVRSQGDATFGGAEFDLYYINNGTDTTSSMKIDTDGDGLGDSEEYLPNSKIDHITLDKSGYYETPNSTYLAVGNYKLVETKAPTGYSITDPTTGNPVELTFTITNDGDVISTNAVEVVYQGDVQITKTRNSNDESGFTTPESNAVFDVVLKRYAQQVANANGHTTITVEDVKQAYEQRETLATTDMSNHTVTGMTSMEYEQLVTGEDGVAKSKKLAYGDYVMAQVGGNEETEWIQDVFEFSITQEDQATQYFSATNNDKGYILRLFKKDADTGANVTYTSSAWKIHMLTDVNGKDVSNKTDTNTSKANRLVNGYVTQTVGDSSNKTVYDVFETASSEDPTRESGVFYGSSNGEDDNENSMTTLPVTLKAGTYQLEEVITSEGMTTHDPITFTVSANGITKVNETGQNIIDVTFENNVLYGNVNFAKNLETWEDADFTLVDDDLTQFGFTIYADEDIINPDDGSVLVPKGSVAMKYTHDTTNPFETVEETFADEDGNFSFTNLPLGKYVVKETTQPNGTVINEEEYKVEITQTMFDKSVDEKKALLGLGETTDRSVESTDVKVTVNDEEQTEGNSYEIINKTTKTSISKKTVTGEDELEGAKLSIKDKDNNTIVEWTSTDEAYNIEGLTSGETYYLTEDLAPLGYVKATTVEFTVTNDDEIHATTMIDKVVTTSKVDMGGKEVVGAEMSVTEKDSEEVIDSWTSDETSHNINNLEEGKTYVLHEVTTPNGYVRATDIEFTVTSENEEGVKVDQTVDMTDKRVSIDKTDGNGNEVEGAKITITDEEGNTVDEWTSTNEKHYVNNLEVGKTYTWHEDYSEEIFGYYYAEEYTFTVTDDGIDQELEMVDKPIKYQINKIDDKGNFVIGVTLELSDITKDEAGNYINTDESGDPIKIELPNNGVTEGKPIELVKQLEAGHTYALDETEIVAGVYKTNRVEFTVDQYNPSNDEFVVVDMIDATTAVSVRKINESGNPVKGAKMSVLETETDEAGNVVAAKNEDGTEKVVYEFTTTDDEKGTDISEYVKGGETYILREDESPFGFDKVEERTFTVTGEASVYQVLLVKDNHSKEYIRAEKVDALKMNKKLAGAVLELYNAKTNKLVAKGTTGNDGTVTFEVKWNDDNEGYYIKETKAPNGYKLSSDRYVVSKATAEVGLDKDSPVVVVITNESVPNTGISAPWIAISCLSVSLIALYFLLSKKKISNTK